METDTVNHLNIIINTDQRIHSKMGCKRTKTGWTQIFSRTMMMMNLWRVCETQTFNLLIFMCLSIYLPTFAEVGWRIELNPKSHPINQLEFDVIIGADGRRNTLPSDSPNLIAADPTTVYPIFIFYSHHIYSTSSLKRSI